MKKTFQKIFILMFLILILFSNLAVSADTGPKPSITITLKNMKGSNYFLDLLTDSNEKYDPEEFILSYNPMHNGEGENDEPSNVDYSKQPIYLYNEAGWVATALRENLLWGSVEGNLKHLHKFTYFGVPDEFKVIIQYPDGTLKVSELIIRDEMDFEIELDVDTMEIVNTGNKVLKIKNIAFCVIITIIIELLIALIFKIKYVLDITFANLLTNIFLQILLNFFVSQYMLAFLIGEIFVVIIEFLIYKKVFKEISTKKVILYTICANLITALLTFVI